MLLHDDIQPVACSALGHHGCTHHMHACAPRAAPARRVHDPPGDFSGTVCDPAHACNEQKAFHQRRACLICIVIDGGAVAAVRSISADLLLVASL